MNKFHELINTGLIVLVIILVLVVSKQSVPLGATGTRFPNGLSTNSTSPSAGELLTTTLQVGSSGTDQTKQISGTCTGTVPLAVFNASSTQEWICSATGVADGDKIFASLEVDIAGTSVDHFSVIGTRATTSGVFGVRVLNLGNGTTTESSYRFINYFIAD